MKILSTETNTSEQTVQFLIRLLLKVQSDQGLHCLSFLLHLLHAYEPGREKTCLMSYANNKGADQPAHPHSLISAFVVRCLDSVMSPVSVTKISSPMLASVAEQANLSLAWSETPKDTFCHVVAHIYMVKQHCLNSRTIRGIIEPRQANLCLRAFRHDKF